MVCGFKCESLSKIASVIKENDNFCVCGHINPDGDCIGSTLGLTWALRSLGKTAVPLLAQDGALDEIFSFLPLASEFMNAGSFSGECDVFISVDVPGDARLGKAASALKSSTRLTITIDHHISDTPASDFNYVDASATSTTMLVWELVKELKLDETKDISQLATCIFTGLLTDSGCFQNKNVYEETFLCASQLVAAGADVSEISKKLYQTRSLASVKVDSIAVNNIEFITSENLKSCAISHISSSEMKSIGAKRSDTESAIDLIRSIQGIDIACILKEHEGQTRGSIRAKDDTDVSLIAKEFGGGGHKSAAGFTLEESLSSALDTVKNRLSGVV